MPAGLCVVRSDESGLMRDLNAAGALPRVAFAYVYIRLMLSRTDASLYEHSRYYYSAVYVRSTIIMIILK